MKRKVVMSLMIGAMSVSMLAGCGRNKEVEKVDDSTVQVTDKDPINQGLSSPDVTDKLLNGSSSEAEEIINEMIKEVPRNVVEELGIEVIEGSFLPEMSFSMGKLDNGKFTGETLGASGTVGITSTVYSVADDTSGIEVDGAYSGLEAGSSYATKDYGTDISIEPTKDGYVKTFFNFSFSNGWRKDFNTLFSAYDKNTGACLIPLSFDYVADGSIKETTATVIVDGVEYECIIESSFKQDIGEDRYLTYITMAVEHPVEYNANDIIFAVGSPTAEIELKESDDISNLRDDYDIWNLCNATYYSYSN